MLRLIPRLRSVCRVHQAFLSMAIISLLSYNLSVYFYRKGFVFPRWNAWCLPRNLDATTQPHPCWGITLLCMREKILDLLSLAKVVFAMCLLCMAHNCWMWSHSVVFIPFALVSRKKMDEDLVNMVVKDSQPFSLVKDEGFRGLVNKLRPTYVLQPDRYME